MPNLDEDECRRRFASARRLVLATTGSRGPDLVPVTFALVAGPDGDEIVTAVDHKPKRTTALRRLDNIATDPSVTLLADRYDEDWDRLWWVRARGLAVVLDPTESATSVALDALADRYEQYRAARPTGAVVGVIVTEWRGWAAR